MVLEVLAGTLKLSPQAPGLFLSALSQACLHYDVRNEASTPPKTLPCGDMIVPPSTLDGFMVLLLVRTPAHAPRLEAALLRVMLSGTVPFQQVCRCAVITLCGDHHEKKGRAGCGPKSQLRFYFGLAGLYGLATSLVSAQLGRECRWKCFRGMNTCTKTCLRASWGHRLEPPFSGFRVFS